MFRHASLSENGVVEESLTDYLKNKCIPKPTIKGIHVLKCAYTGLAG